MSVNRIGYIRKKIPLFPLTDQIFFCIFFCYYFRHENWYTNTVNFQKMLIYFLFEKKEGSKIKSESRQSELNNICFYANTFMYCEI